jgi:lysophospholipase L1-like esterase
VFQCILFSRASEGLHVGTFIEKVAVSLIVLLAAIILFLAGVHLGAKAVATGGPIAATQKVLAYLRGSNRFGQFGAIYEGTVKQTTLRCSQINRAVVFIGDSNTYGLATSNIAPRSENLGVNGDTIEHVRYRLRGCDLRRATVLVLAIGTNNWASDGYAQFGRKYRSLLSAMPPRVPLIAAAILPINERRLAAFYDTQGMTKAINSANRDIVAACRARPGCLFVPVPRELYAPDGALANWADAGEGVHLSKAGYLRWGKALSAAIVKIQPR